MARFKGIFCCMGLLALLVLQVASANAVAAGQPEGTVVAGLSQVQPVSDSALRDLRGKGIVILNGFGNNLTGQAFLVNQVNGGSATQSSTITDVGGAAPITLSGPGTLVQPLPPNITTTLQSLQQLFQGWRR